MSGLLWQSLEIGMHGTARFGLCDDGEQTLPESEDRVEI